MQKELEMFTLETDILMMEYERDMKYLGDTIMYESADKKSKNVFAVAIEKIKEMFRKLAEKVKEFLSKEKTKKTIEDTENILKTNPKAKGIKVKRPDYDKVNKLTVDTAKELKKAKSKDDVERIMEKYKKQRNALLATSAFITVSLGTLILRLKKSNANIEQCKNSLMTEIDDLRGKYDKLNNSFTQKSNDFKKYDELDKKYKNASEQIVRMKDSMQKIIKDSAEKDVENFTKKVDLKLAKNHANDIREWSDSYQYIISDVIKSLSSLAKDCEKTSVDDIKNTAQSIKDTLSKLEKSLFKVYAKSKRIYELVPDMN